ncbi:MAG: cytidylate kinase family protein [bacterium]|nr:cytidylate kinase family protein [bacterium]
MVITINGAPGSGKSTVTDRLAKLLHYKTIDIGQLRRKAAQQKGMSLHEFNAWSEAHPSAGDRAFDRQLVTTVRRQPRVVISSRTAWHFFPDSFKVMLTVDPHVGAKRTLENRRERQSELGTHRSITSVMRLHAKRVRSDRKRYRALYGVDFLQKRQYDIVLDTSRIPIPTVIRKVTTAFRSWKKAR